MEQADIFAVIGSSLNVYPAAGLIRYAPANSPIFLIDPKPVRVPTRREVAVIQEVASKGVPLLRDRLKQLD